MDEDLEAMTREQLVAEAKRLRAGSGRTGTVLDMRSAGITLRSGASYPRRPTRCRRSPRGRSSSAAACATASPWTSSCPTRPAPTRRIGRDRCCEA